MMNKKEFLHLKSGTDVRGTAVETAEHGVQLTDETVQKICVGFYKWYCRKEQVDTFGIAVGQDCRISSPRIAAAALAAFCACGCRVFDCGLATTPSMFMSIVENEPVQTALEITASHHPFDRNGLKFFTSGGGLEGEDVSAILELAYDAEVPAGTDNAPVELPFMNDYAALLRRQIVDGVQNGDRPLEGLHIVVDAGNGVGGFYADQVLAPLGADVSGSQFLEPDGMFPNHIPNPENKQAMDSVRAATVEHHADMGIIFDTDVDRMSAVLHDGSEVNRDAIIAMISAIIAPDYPGGTIVTDSVTSDKLTDFLENTLHLKHHRFKRGYKNVINESKRLNAAGVQSPLAIETSGHGALSENYFLDDGAYLAVKLLIAAAKARREGKRIDTLIEKLPRQFECREYRMNISGEDFKAYGQQVLEQFEQRARAAGYAVAPNSYEGVRLTFGSEQVQGWVLLRLSLHDPLMPLNMEGNRPGDCDRLCAVVRTLLDGFDRLDQSKLF